MDLVVIALALVLVTLLVMAVGVALAARALQHRNRVSPEVASAAPLTWLGAPGSGARLHRRLRSAVAVARRACAGAPSAAHLADLTAELEREAVALDTQLVVASQVRDKQGRVQMSALAQQVRQVERLASQVALLAVQAQAPLLGRGQASALEELGRQLDSLEQARDEVGAVEAAAGVERVSPYADPNRPASTRVAPSLRKPPPGQAQPGV